MKMENTKIQVCKICNRVSHRVYTRRNNCRVAPQQLKSVYTGHDNATIANNLNFVSGRHKSNEASVYCQGFVVLCGSCHTASSEDNITDYDHVLLRRSRPM